LPTRTLNCFFSRMIASTRSVDRSDEGGLDVGELV
jgi:hypothetical protein